MRLVFAVFWLTWLLRGGARLAHEGRLDSWTINRMDPNQRLLRYAARALAWPEEDFNFQLQQLEGLRFF